MSRSVALEIAPKIMFFFFTILRLKKNYLNVSTLSIFL